MRKQIKLYRDSTGWIAHFREYGPTGWKVDQEVTALFGIHAIPTPFTARAKAEKVVTEIQRLNPDHDVVIGTL